MHSEPTIRVVSTERCFSQVGGGLSALFDDQMSSRGLPRCQCQPATHIINDVVLGGVTQPRLTQPPISETMLPLAQGKLGRYDISLRSDD